MKLNNKYIMTAGIVLALASCDLDKFPEGQYVSDEQKENIVESRPNLITAEANAMAARLNFYGTISDDATTYHSDFGVPAVALQLESGGQDIVSSTSGYNWFNRSQNYADRDYADASGAEFIWKIFYNHMKAANDLLNLIDPDMSLPWPFLSLRKP